MPATWSNHRAQAVLPSASASQRAASELRRMGPHVVLAKTLPIRGQMDFSSPLRTSRAFNTLWRHDDEFVTAMVAAPPRGKRFFRGKARATAGAGEDNNFSGSFQSLDSWGLHLPVLAEGNGNSSGAGADVMTFWETGAAMPQNATFHGGMSSRVQEAGGVDAGYHSESVTDVLYHSEPWSRPLPSKESLSTSPKCLPNPSKAKLLVRSPRMNRDFLSPRVGTLLAHSPQAETSSHLLQTPSLIWARFSESAKSPRGDVPSLPSGVFSLSQNAAPQMSMSQSWMRPSDSLTSLSVELAQERLDDITLRLRSYLHLDHHVTAPPQAAEEDSKVPQHVSTQASVHLPEFVSPRDHARHPALHYYPPSSKRNESASPRESKRLTAVLPQWKPANMRLAPRSARKAAMFLSKTSGADSVELGNSPRASHGSHEPDSPKSPRRQSKEKESKTITEEFDICCPLSKQYRIPLNDVKLKHQEFLALDLNGNGELSKSEFEEAIRQHCRIPKGQDLPPHLVHSFMASADKDNSGSLDFEEYLCYCMAHEFSEEWMVVDETERLIRQVARQHNFNLVDVENVRLVFEAFDADKSGSIDKEEFRNCLCKLLGASKPTDITENRMKRYWSEVDTDNSGSISLDEFVVWYLTML